MDGRCVQAPLLYLSISYRLVALFFFSFFFVLLSPRFIQSFTSYLLCFTILSLSLSAWYFTLMGSLRELSKVWPKGREQNWKKEGKKKWGNEREREREGEVALAVSHWKGSFSFLLISGGLPAYLTSPPLFSLAHKSPFSLAHMYANKASYANETGRDGQQRGERNGQGMKRGSSEG